jgi:hypothetical protein
MPPLGKYLPRIAPADAMIIDFGSKSWVVALWNRCFEASVQKAQNGLSTQLIEATSCVERSNATIQAKELSYLSSHQMLTADKNWQSYQSPMKLVKSWRSWAPIAFKLLTERLDGSSYLRIFCLKVQVRNKIAEKEQKKQNTPS